MDNRDPCSHHLYRPHPPWIQAHMEAERVPSSESPPCWCYINGGGGIQLRGNQLQAEYGPVNL